MLAPVPSVADVLWTGGWDSTYRVLDLTLNQGRTVRPHYLIDPVRESTAAELRAIRRIKEEAEKRGGQILPLRVTPIFEIPADAEVTDAYRRLRSQAHLGGQYDWISRYARSLAAEGSGVALELSIHRDDKAEAFLRSHVTREDDELWALAPGASADLGAVFGALRFPILHMSKTQIDAAADRGGFRDVMERTWFCFDPRHGQPCGVCMPCRYTNEEGMGYRLPRSAHLRRRFDDARAVAQKATAPARPLVGTILRKAGLRS